MGSRDTSSSYADLLNNLWNPTEESVAKIRRLQELEEMRKQRVSVRREPAAETAGMSSRQRFFHNYQPPASRFTRSSQMPFLENRRQSEPFQRSFSENRMSSQPTEVNAGVPRAFPSYTDRPAPYSTREEPATGYHSGVPDYTGSAPQRIAYIDDTGKTHWLDPSSPLINMVARPDPTSPDGIDRSVRRSASFEGQSPVDKTAPTSFSPGLLSSPTTSGDAFASRFPMSAQLLQNRNEEDMGHATHFSGSYLGGPGPTGYSGASMGGYGSSAYSGVDIDIPWEVRFPSAAKLLLKDGQNSELKTPGLAEAQNLDPGFICEDIPLEERFPLAAQILAMKQFEEAQQEKLAATQSSDSSGVDVVTEGVGQLHANDTTTKPEILDAVAEEEEEPQPKSPQTKTPSSTENETQSPLKKISDPPKSPTTKSPSEKQKSAPKVPPLKVNSKSPTTKSPPAKPSEKSAPSKSPVVKEESKSPGFKTPPGKQDSVRSPKSPAVKQDNKSPTLKSRAPSPPKSDKAGEKLPTKSEKPVEKSSPATNGQTKQQTNGQTKQQTNGQTKKQTNGDVVAAEDEVTTF